jgi:hypothetical protein
MNRLTRFILPGMLLFFVVACAGPEGFKKPEDALDAGREFIRSVLDGDYKKAEMYVIKDDEDIRLFSRYRAYMKKRPQEELQSLKSASIIINKVEALNDSVSIINYANSYSKKPVEIKVVRKNGEWWIDFSYTFSRELPTE